MSWWGKLIGGVAGFAVGGPIGALLGAAVGHQFDSGLKQLGVEGVSGVGQEALQGAFFTTLFSVMGHLAKSDGRVSEAEVASVESLMARMQLNNQQRATAIRLFNEGKQPQFPFRAVIQQFYSLSPRQRNLHRVLVEILLEAAFADGALSDPEMRILQDVCELVEMSRADLDTLIRMRKAGGAQARQTAIADPYAVLGVDRNASDGDIKRAYRRLMSQHHPDKLVSKGLPEEMMDLAEEKTRQIRAAWDQIKAQRGL